MAHSTVRSPTHSARKRVSRQDYDSPSKQLLKDLEHALENIQLHEVEEHKVRAFERNSWYGQLDQWDQERASLDFAAIDAATARHEAVRSEAEKELQKYYNKLEEEQRKREEEQKRLREKEAKEKAEREQQEREQAARRAAEQKAKEEAQRKAAEAAKAKAEAEARTRKEREETEAREIAERERKEKEEKERKAEEEKTKKDEEERARQHVQTAQLAATASNVGQAAVSQVVEARHQRYLEIHQRLKEFRRTFWDECKKNKEIKTQVGDLRRSIKTSVGQLVEITPENRKANNKPTLTIRSNLQQATRIQAPLVNLNDFLLTPLETPTGSPQAPSVLIYALNIFSKAIITQFSNESGVNSKAAEPAGILVANVFANPEFQFHGRPLIDVLLAKFHKVCPVLFGISGPENTAQGKKRLGWRQEDGQFVSDNRHGERMTGLGAGFAAIALRNFSKSANKNPYPATHYWEAFASIVNTRNNETQPTHLLVLKGMIENSSERFITFFNAAAIAALRRALKDLPQSLPGGLQKSPACNALTLLHETLKRDKQIEL